MNMNMNMNLFVREVVLLSSRHDSNPLQHQKEIPCAE
jgi:hypothetical protein